VRDIAGELPEAFQSLRPVRFCPVEAAAQSVPQASLFWEVWGRRTCRSGAATAMGRENISSDDLLRLASHRILVLKDRSRGAASWRGTVLPPATAAEALIDVIG
jgi:hypothetical protein